MTPTEARELVIKGGTVPTGDLTLAATKVTKTYSVWAWTDEAGAEHVTKVMGTKVFGWSPDCQSRGFSFIESNKLDRLTT